MSQKSELRPLAKFAPALFLLRLIQGFGLAAVVPGTYSFVPHLVRSRAQTVAFATLGAAGNVAMAICPPLGLTPELTGILHTIPDVRAVRPGADKAGRDQGVQ